MLIEEVRIRFLAEEQKWEAMLFDVDTGQSKTFRVSLGDIPLLAEFYETEPEGLLTMMAWTQNYIKHNHGSVSRA